MTEMDELCRDIQMKLPDEIWMLDPLERYCRGASFTDDFARMDGRFYVFGVIEVPLAYTEGSFTWGCWIEVDQCLHDGYLEAFRAPDANRLSGKGTLANEIPGYDDAMGAEVEVRFAEDRRPIFSVSTTSSLGREQRSGLTEQAHRTLDEILFGDDEDDETEELS